MIVVLVSVVVVVMSYLPHWPFVSSLIVGVAGGRGHRSTYVRWYVCTYARVCVLVLHSWAAWEPEVISYGWAVFPGRGEQGVGDVVALVILA